MYKKIAENLISQGIPQMEANSPSPFAVSKLTSKLGGDSFELLSGPALIIILVVFVLSLIVVASFWSSPDKERLSRQRLYARVDDLYFPLIGIICNNETIEEIRKLEGVQDRIARFFDTFLPVEIRLTSISLGGAAIKTEKQFEKGQTVILKMSMLPDYPTQEDYIAFKVTWVRPAKKPEIDSRHDVGLQKLEVFNSESDPTLKTYLNYLLDEPAA